MKCKTLADLYTEAARVAKMIEGTSLTIGECVKVDNIMSGAKVYGKGVPTFNSSPEHYDFALFLVEGKPVFEGDVLYSKIICAAIAITNLWEFQDHTLSWNPPKPKTVMVELPINMANCYAIMQNQDISVLSEACKKALEEQ